MVSTHDFHSTKRLVETEAGGVALAVTLLVIVLCAFACFCWCRRRRMKDDEHRMYTQYLERLRAGELPNLLIDEENGDVPRRRRSSASRPAPVETGSAQRRQSRIAEFEERARNSMVIEPDVEADVPMAEVVMITSPVPISPAAVDARRASRTYGSPSRNSVRRHSQPNSPQKQQHYVEDVDYVDERRQSINALAELAMLERALEESKDEYSLRSVLANSQTAQEEQRLRQVLEESEFAAAQEFALEESEQAFVQTAVAESEAVAADQDAVRYATDESILVNNPMRPSHIVERMMDELGDRVARQSMGETRTLSPTTSRESITRQYRVYQNGSVADRVLARSRSRQSTTSNGSSRNNMALDLEDDIQYGSTRGRRRGRMSI